MSNYSVIHFTSLPPTVWTMELRTEYAISKTKRFRGSCPLGSL